MPAEGLPRLSHGKRGGHLHIKAADADSDQRTTMGDLAAGTTSVHAQAESVPRLAAVVAFESLFSGACFMGLNLG